jgi:hypothetical protein
VTESRELNIFGLGDGDIPILRPKKVKISGPAFAGLPYMATFP